MNTDKSWKRFGEEDPYFGVFSHEKYRSNNLTDQALEEFFRSGEEHAQKVLATLRDINPAFSPQRTLDFGCGVGRVTIPLAHACASVLGVDVAPGMLSQAQKNASLRGVSNIEFSHDVKGNFNFVHSVIVFQHIPPRRGMPILADLGSRLEASGMIVLQVPYERDVPVWRKAATAIKRTDPMINGLLNLIEGRGFSYPTMTMFCYDVSSILRILNRVGIENIRITLDAPAMGYENLTLYGEKRV